MVPVACYVMMTAVEFGIHLSSKMAIFLYCIVLLHTTVLFWRCCKPSWIQEYLRIWFTMLSECSPSLSQAVVRWTLENVSERFQLQLLSPVSMPSRSITHLSSGLNLPYWGTNTGNVLHLSRNFAWDKVILVWIIALLDITRENMAFSWDFIMENFFEGDVRFSTLLRRITHMKLIRGALYRPSSFQVLICAEYDFLPVNRLYLSLIFYQ